jgi:hypothetical protein
MGVSFFSLDSPLPDSEEPSTLSLDSDNEDFHVNKFFFILDTSWDSSLK